MALVDLTGPLFITLLEHEIRQVMRVACERRLWAIRKGADHGKGWSGGTETFGVGEWENEVQSSAAECAASVAIGQPCWMPLLEGEDSEGDLAPGVQVRHTRHPNGKLLIYSSDRALHSHGRPDNPDHEFILVRGLLPTLEVRGWIYARDVQEDDKPPEQRKHWNADGRDPCYWVPASELNDMPEVLQLARYDYAAPQ